MTIYTWTQERNLGIARALKPVEGFHLSGVALVVDAGVGYAYIKFTEDTVRKLGKKMPYGIGPDNPAFIKIVNKHSHYDVMCVYADKSKALHLWRSETLPDWASKFKYKK